MKAQFSVLISTMDREELPTLSSSQKRANLSFSISNILHGESNAIRDQDRPPGLSINAKEEHSDADVSEDDELEENTHLRVPQVQRSSAGVEPGSPNFSSLQNFRLAHSWCLPRRLGRPAWLDLGQRRSTDPENCRDRSVGTSRPAAPSCLARRRRGAACSAC